MESRLADRFSTNFALVSAPPTCSTTDAHGGATQPWLAGASDNGLAVQLDVCKLGIFTVLYN